MFKLLHYQRPLPPCPIRRLTPSPLYQMSLIQCRMVYPNFPKAIRSLSRFVYLSILYLPLVSACSLHFAYHHFILKKYSQPSRFLLRWIVWSLEISGPTFIKLGQWASTRIDLFPKNACEELSRLQDKVNPHAFQYTLAALEREFGRERVKECFLDIDPEPIGIGAVSQVHVANVKHPITQKVQKCAVKVLHPGVEDLIAIDLSIIRGLASIVNTIIPGAHWMSFPEEAAYFSEMMTQQLDLKREAANLNKFRKNFRDWPSVHFPAPIDQLVSQSVLVEELIDGIPIEKVLKVADSSLKSQLATIGLESFLEMLVIHNFVHSDLHPGNIFLSFYKNGQGIQWNSLPNEPFIEQCQRIRKMGYDPALVYIDAGMTTSLSPQNLINFLDLFHAITLFDGQKVGHLMIERSVTPHTAIHTNMFQQKMDRIIQNVKWSTLSLSKIQFSELLLEVLGMVREHHVKLEGEFANMAVGILLLEGLGRRLDPHVDLISSAIPVLAREQHIRKSLIGYGYRLGMAFKDAYQKDFFPM